MKRIYLVTALFLFLNLGCDSPNNTIEKSKNEILQTEKAFNDHAQKEGIAAAFLYYAADSAVLMRSNRLIIGKEAIKTIYGTGNSSDQNVSLTWEPDFVDVSSSSDLGYTYGKYVYTIIDSLGTAKSDTGIFHTVWKRQQNGQWRFMWD